MTAGIVMMEHLVTTADRRDVAVIDQVAPITREVGRIAAQYPSESTRLEVSVGSDHTGSRDVDEEGERDDDESAAH